MNKILYVILFDAIFAYYMDKFNPYFMISNEVKIYIGINIFDKIY